MSKIISLIVMCILFACVGCSLKGETRVIQVEVSPDGEYVAYVFEWSTGATTDFTYRLSILEKDDRLEDDDQGNIYVCEHEMFDVEWLDSQTLKVNNRNTPLWQISKQETQIGGVKIIYDRDAQMD